MELLLLEQQQNLHILYNEISSKEELFLSLQILMEISE
jgi:hypothetical protein